MGLNIAILLIERYWCGLASPRNRKRMSTRMLNDYEKR
jgi:hypothetical protein